jgi:hypothetical protein
MFDQGSSMTLHLITICVGFIIAYGLLQLVRLFQRRQRRRAAEAAARAAKSSGDSLGPSPPAAHRS